jgi:hypothetical protein
LIKGTCVGDLFAEAFQIMADGITQRLKHGKNGSKDLTVEPILVELHDSHSHILPIYPSTDSNKQALELSPEGRVLCPMVLLGCVQDHLETIGQVKSMAKLKRIPVLQVKTRTNAFVLPHCHDSVCVCVCV